jgi:membrane protein DedA with SNARE-associated domain
LPAAKTLASRYNGNEFLLLFHRDLVTNGLNFAVLALLFHPSSYFGIVVFLILTGCGMPVPEEVAIVLAGVLSAEEKLYWGWALLSCLVGALLGDCVMYGIGRRFGETLLSAHPRLSKLLGAEREKRFEDAIERHAFKVMILARFMVGVRGPVYLAAGVIRMPFRKFILIDLICATLVVSLVFGLSYLFGAGVLNWIRDAEWTLTITIALVSLIAGVYLFWNRKSIAKAIFGEKKSGEN